MPALSPTSSSHLVTPPDVPSSTSTLVDTWLDQQQVHIPTHLKPKTQAQLQQKESDIIDKHTQALVEQATSHQLEMEKLRTELSGEHKTKLNKKVHNIHANHAGILAKKETELKNLTSELYDANQLIRKLQKSSGPKQNSQAIIEATLQSNYETQLQTKTRNIHTYYSGVIAKKDSQYQELSKEMKDAKQALDGLVLTKQEQEAEKAQLRKEHAVEIVSLRESYGREIVALKSGEFPARLWMHGA